MSPVPEVLPVRIAARVPSALRRRLYAAERPKALVVVTAASFPSKRRSAMRDRDSEYLSENCFPSSRELSMRVTSLMPISSEYGGTAPRTKASITYLNRIRRSSAVQPMWASRPRIENTGSPSPMIPITAPPWFASRTRSRSRRPYPLDTGIDQWRVIHRKSRALCCPRTTGSSTGSI